ncbi:MAG: DNA primase [Clostridium sp.]|nr:DNA primase [Bacteroides sp.]MCM1198544.1 DNA primase [Clostridium sp.]
MIPKETVDKILDTARIEDVVGDFVTLKRRGANYIACCPFHNEKTPSFSVSPSKGIYKCFGCGKSGTAVGFVMEHETLSYVEALKYLAAKYHIEVQEKEETAEEIASRQRNESLLLVSEYAWKFFKASLQSPEGQAIGYQYFKSRGLEDSTIGKFGLGWAPTGRNTLAKAARGDGFKEEFLVDTGLCIKRDDGSLVDRFYDRVVFPIHSVGGRVIAFGCRTLKTDKSVAKYVNSPETEIYIKSKSLYGIYFAKNEIARQDRCILVEGYLDVISMHQLGITNVVASSGTSLTIEQIRLIRKFTENVTIIYDGDSAGIHAALRGIGLVLKEGLNVKVVLLPDGDDPDSYSRKHTLDEVNAFIEGHAQDFISFKTDLLLGEAGDDPLKKANLINDIADTIAMIPDAVKRSVYVESCGMKFSMDPQILFGRIAHTRREMIENENRQQERERQREENRRNAAAAVAPLPSHGYSVEDIPGLPPEESMPPVDMLPPDVTVGDAVEDPLLEPCEKELLEFILTNGQDILMFDSDSDFFAEEPMNVADFIDSSLAADNEDFVNVIYRNAYEKYFEYYEDGLGQEQITTRMMDDQDRRLANLVSDALIPKYDLTVTNFRESMTTENTRLVTYVPRAILTYKARRIERKISGLKSSMLRMDEAALVDAMKEITTLNSTRNIIMEKLGRGIVKK